MLLNLKNKNLNLDEKVFYEKSMSRSYQQELEYLEQINDYSWRIKKGFVPNMNVSEKKLTGLQIPCPCQKKYSFFNGFRWKACSM